MLLVRRSLMLAAMSCLGVTASATAQSSPTGAFVIRLGKDTIAVERFTRSGSAYNVEQVLRAPATSWRHTHLELTPAEEVGVIFLMHHAIGAAPDAPLLASTKLTSRTSDSADVETREGPTVSTRRVRVRRGLIPTLPQSFLAYDLAAARLLRLGVDSVTVTLLSPAGDTTPVVVRRISPDSMTFRLPFLTYGARVDSAGRILKLAQPLGTSVERVPDVDVNRLAKAWAAEDASGKGMGPLSPADSGFIEIAGARVGVRYSRPRARGRPVFGQLVPYDVVWRTGAGNAVLFETDRDILVGGTAVPAGRYTLFTIMSQTGATLIINRETERNGNPISGTEHDPRHDLGRVAMVLREVDPPVDQFTIALVPAGAALGELRITWDRRQMSVPIRPK
jgi:hypothetical protein